MNYKTYSEMRGNSQGICVKKEKVFVLFECENTR